MVDNNDFIILEYFIFLIVDVYIIMYLLYCDGNYFFVCFVVGKNNVVEMKFI